MHRFSKRWRVARSRRRGGRARGATGKASSLQTDDAFGTAVCEPPASGCFKNVVVRLAGAEAGFAAFADRVHGRAGRARAGGGGAALALRPDARALEKLRVERDGGHRPAGGAELDGDEATETATRGRLVSTSAACSVGVYRRAEPAPEAGRWG